MATFVFANGPRPLWASSVCVFISCLVLLVPATALGQQTVTTASLSGTVRDAGGAEVADAAVTLTNFETGLRLTAVTGASGRFRFASVEVGSYLLVVSHDGFANAERRVTLTVGQALVIPVELRVGEIAESVDVRAAARVVEAARTQVSETILPREIDDLPLNGRNYLDLALLVPAVSRTNTGSNQRFAETSAVPGTGISIAGQRNLDNSFLVDGGSANDDAADLAGTFYSQEVIREFQVITSGGVAEYGRTSGGVVNVVTKSGTNDWRGRLYGFFRNQRFDARNPLAPRKDPLTQAQYGATIGGPIRRNRTFVFANFEQTRRNDSTVVTISPANVAAINAGLTAFGYRGDRIETGIVPGGLDTTNVFARVDHNLGDTNRLAVRYSLYDLGATNSRTVGGLNAVSRGTGLDARDQTVTVSNLTTLSSRSINEARFQFTRSRLAAPVNDAVGPAVNISGVASFGTATFSPTVRDVDSVELIDTFATERGRHAVKLGVDFLYNRVTIQFPGAVQGVYGFTSLGDFLAGRSASFQQAFGEAEQFQSNPNIGLFVQDEWRATNDLTINAGLRYDAQFLPDPIATDGNNFAPRIGLAWAPGDGKTVVRASYGLFFDRVPLRATSNALQRDGSRYVVLQISPQEAAAPVFPDVLATRPASVATRPSISRIDPSIENPYSQQASLEVERELFGGASLSVGYLHLRSAHLIRSRNVNVPRFPGSAGVPNLGRPDPEFGNISYYEGSGNSFYDGLVVAFVERPTRWMSARVSYTLSKAIDDAGNFFFSSPQDSFDLRDERGLSDNDQRHRLAVSGTFAVPSGHDDTGARRIVEGWQLGYVFTYASRLPFNVLLGADRNVDTNFNDRPVGVGRNTGRGFDFASLDLRASRVIRAGERISVEVLAEAFNVLNRSNFSVPNATFGPGPNPLPSFGRPTAASDPRQVQLGLRLNF